METRVPALWRKLLAIPVVIAGVLLVAYYALPIYFSQRIVLAFLMITIIVLVVGVFRGARSNAAYIGFLLLLLLFLFFLMTGRYPWDGLYVYLYEPEIDAWGEHYYRDFRVIVYVLISFSAYAASTRFAYRLKKSLEERSFRSALWWIPGALMCVSKLLAFYLMLQYKNVYAQNYAFIGWKPYYYGLTDWMNLVFFAIQTVTLLYICRLLWLDYQYQMSVLASASPAPALRQNASAAATKPAAQNALADAGSASQTAAAPAQPQTSAAAKPAPDAPADGVPCPSCGALMPTAGRKTGMVFCTECGAGVDLGGSTEGVVDDALAEQIATLKRMRDGDLITQEEFEAKKRQLLGL